MVFGSKSLWTHRENTSRQGRCCVSLQSLGMKHSEIRSSSANPHVGTHWRGMIKLYAPVHERSCTITRSPPKRGKTLVTIPAIPLTGLSSREAEVKTHPSFASLHRAPQNVLILHYQPPLQPLFRYQQFNSTILGVFLCLCEYCTCINPVYPA